MRITFTVRLTEQQANWLADTSRRSDIPVSRIIRDELEKARKAGGTRPFMRHVGKLSAPPDLSTRQGFSRS
jgi:hypothetical protein